MVRVRAHSLAGRIARLRDILFNLRRWIARMVTRFDNLKRGVRYVLAAPPPCVVRDLARVATDCADTS